ncbi:YoaK family protein [Undibacterium sp. Di26W]|uniref:YoaK family protein n=1 Tax=Undibacterium sp. Di26W TaxID=3413035 RepID=UPI003BF0C254
MEQNKYLGVGLGFVAGYVDTVGFVSLFGLFTAHVTGNFVLIGSELAHPSHGVLIKFLAFPAFVAAVALTRLLVIRLQEKNKKTLNPVLGMQIAFLLAFMILGWIAQPIQAADTWAALSAGIAGAAAMGVQNAASRLVFTDIAPTTVMTGNVTQLVIDLLDYMRADSAGAIGQRINKFLWPVLAFGSGAIGGAFACMYWQFWSLLVPIFILAGFMLGPVSSSSMK